MAAAAAINPEIEPVMHEHDLRRFEVLPGYNFWSQVRAQNMADHHCGLCHGNGVGAHNGSTGKVCGCVYRAAFSACLSAYLSLQEQIKSAGCLLGIGSPNVHLAVEYAADFILLARRALDHDAFRLLLSRYLRQEGWQDSCHAFGIARRTLFDRAQKLEETLGQVFSETSPYGIYPPGRYFSCSRS